MREMVIDWHTKSDQVEHLVLLIGDEPALVGTEIPMGLLNVTEED